MTRAEHIRWCKKRAKEEFDYYLEKAGLEAAIRNGVASMTSDLRKHPDTLNLMQAAILIGMTIHDAARFQEYIDGFTE